jgi:Family of unknown function (DUF5670)
MSWTLVVMFLILWLLGFCSHVGGALIHIVLLIAMMIFLIFSLKFWPTLGVTRVIRGKDWHTWKRGFAMQFSTFLNVSAASKAP